MDFFENRFRTGNRNEILYEMGKTKMALGLSKGEDK